MLAQSWLVMAGKPFFFLFVMKTEGNARHHIVNKVLIWMVILQNIAPEPSQRSLWQTVNKETKGEKRLIVLEKDVPQFFNIFCPDAQRYCSRVGGAGEVCVWQGCCRCRVMGHYSRAIDFITVPLTYPSLTLSKCPCQPLIHLIPWLSILTAFGQKGQYFLWCAPELYNTVWKWRRWLHQSSARKDGNMMYCNHTLPVGFIKFSLFTHSQAYCKGTHKNCMHHHTRGQERKSINTPHTPYICCKHPYSLFFFSLSLLPISLMKSRLPCRDCTWQTHEQVFPPEEMRSKWESNMTALLWTAT